MASNSTERNKRLARDLREAGGKHIVFKASAESVKKLEELMVGVSGLKSQQAAIDYCIDFTHAISVERRVP